MRKSSNGNFNFQRLTSPSAIGRRIISVSELRNPIRLKELHLENKIIGAVNPKIDYTLLAGSKINEIREANGRVIEKHGINLYHEISRSYRDGSLDEASLVSLLKTAYPGADRPGKLCKQDSADMLLFYNFGLEKIDQIEEQKNFNDCATIACCRRTPNLDYYNFEFSGFFGFSKSIYEKEYWQ